MRKIEINALRHKAFRFICFILLSGTPVFVFSQFDEKDFIAYTTLQGFTDDNVTCITQDHYGFLWVGTSHGLNRFDGINVVQFNYQKTAGSLLSDIILNLQWIDSTQLLVSTSRGLHIINIETFRQRNIIIPAGPRGLESKVNDIRNVLFDKTGHIYVITKTGLYRFDRTWKLIFRYDDYDQVSGEYVGGFGSYSEWLDDGNIIVSGQHGNYQYTISNNSLIRIDNDRPANLIFTVLNHLKGGIYTQAEIRPGIFLVFDGNSNKGIYVDQGQKKIQSSILPLNPLKKEITWRSKIISWNDSTVWVTGQFSGIFRFSIDPSTGEMKMDTVKQFNLHTCNVIFKDHDNRIWLGTNAGLFKQHQGLVKIEFGHLPDSILSHQPKSVINQIALGADEVFATGPLSGGIYIFDKKDLSFTSKGKLNFPSYAYKTSRAIVQWTKDTLLCGTDEGLFWYNSENKSTGSIPLPEWDIQHNWISNMIVDRHHRIWVSCNKDAGYYVNEGSAQRFKWVSLENTVAGKLTEIHQFAEDDNGNVWLVGIGMARYNNFTEQIDYYSEIFPSLRDDSRMISALAFDHKGGMWFGNATNGLVYYNAATQDTIVYTEEDGLPDRLINAIAVDDHYVWISCYSGMGRMDIDHLKLITAISKRDIHFNNITSNRIFSDSLQHTFYIGTGYRMIRFRPGDLKDSITSPRFILENVAFGNDSVLWNPSYKIISDWKHRDLTLSFCAINFHDAEEQSYSYRMNERADTTWIKLGKQRKIFFSSLSPGHHMVEIKVTTADHRWPDQKLFFMMIIQPPFWNTWWFYIFCLAGVSIFIYALLHYRIVQLKKVILVRERISQDLHDEVGATLSGIAMYSYLTKEQMKAGRQDEMEKSLNVIEQSTAEMVTKLNDIIWAVNPQHDSLQKLVQRLEDYALEIASAKGILVEAMISKSLSEIKMPMKSRRNIYLICKEAINNAVKYSGATIIELTVKDFDQFVEFTVSDNGSGFDPDNVRRGNGLENMQKRADDIGAKFVLESGIDKGSSISFYVSLHD